MKNTAMVALWLALAGGILVAQDATVQPLLSKDLVGVPGKEVSMIAVEYPPGGTDPVPAHHAQALVYVLEGSIVMQVRVAHRSLYCRARPSMKDRTTCTSSAETRVALRRPSSWCFW